MKEIIDFFNRNAPNWDLNHHKEDFEAAEILVEKAEVVKGQKVLDVGSGTGILIPFLQKAGAKVTALDVSPRMIEIIREKYPRVKAVTGNFEEVSFFESGGFDRILIYNAFPHFPSPLKVIMRAFSLLKKNGIFLIGHSMNRERLNFHHKKVGNVVAGHMLISNEEMKKSLLKAGFSKVSLEEDRYFFVSAVKS